MLDRTTTKFSHVKPGDTDYVSGGLRDFFLYRDLGIAEATHGKVIAHPSEELVLQQRGMQTHPLVSQFAADGKPHLATFQEGGNEALGYIQGLRFHWAVAAQQNEAELLAPQRQTLVIGLLLLGSAAVLVVLIAMGASKLLVHPIVDMTHAAEHMSIGELDTPIKSTSKDELGMLAKALERLRKSMVAAIARM